MKRLIISLFGIIAMLCPLSAQSISGNVIDEKGQPMQFATVSLRSLPDSAVVAGVITDADGRFEVEGMDAQNAFIQISTIGYATRDIPVSAFSAPQTITMQPDARMLDEVVVSKVRPKTRINGDAVVTTIEGSVLEHSGNAIDVLAKVPGMLSRNGSLEVIGRGEPLYYINGRKVTDNSDLRNLMSEEIKSVEVVSNPGAEYGGNVRCVVRIRTIKRQGEGFSYALTSQAQQHIYDNHDTEPSWSVLDLNYRMKNIEFIGKIVYFNQRTYQISDIYGGTLVKADDGHVRRNLQDGILDYRSHSGGWSYEGGMNWQISDKHSVGAQLSYGSNSFSDTDMMLEADIFSDDEKTDHLYSVNKGKMPASHSFNGNIYYDGNIGKLNINFNADFHDEGGKKETGIKETSVNEPAAISSMTDGVSRMGAGKLVLSYPVWRGTVKLGTEETYVRANEEYSISLDDIPSSKARLTENNISGFAEYAAALPFGHLVAGMRYEHVCFDYLNEYDKEKNVSRVQDNWFPSFSFSTRLGGVGMNIGYTTKIRRPRYDQMSTEIMYDNRFTYQTGDPTLRNEIQKTLSLNANWKWLTFSGTYEVVDNTIQQKGYPYNDDGVAMIQYANAADALHRLNLYLVASPAVGIWNPRYTIGMQKQFFSTTVIDPYADSGGRHVSLNTPMYLLQANNAFRLRHNWQVDFDYQYTSPFDMLMVKITKPMHTMSLAVSKAFLKHDALNVRLSWNDMLNKSVNYISSDYGNCFVQQSNNRYAPSVLLRVSYRFNSANGKYKGTGAGQDAKNRM